MTPTDLNRALERITTCRHVVMEMPAIILTTDFAPQLAALIEAAAKPDMTIDGYLYCRICDDTDHAPDCALVAIVRAINGELP